ncbi:MAG: sigma-70 family RNA polymerase sigma factor [Bacteroidales bacterium]|nr:sigma-70 family RNA polymerase sigma factor [Bacteroidales bacterium]
MNHTRDFWNNTYVENINKLIGICYRYVPNKQIAEDLAHEAFVSAMEKSGSYRGTGCFEAWLRRIAVNSALQYIRKQKAVIYTKYPVQNLPDNMIEPDENTSFMPVAQTGFSHSELLDAINSLPEHHRLVFNMYVIDNYSHKQIGTELGISSGTSKSHLSRARKQIQKLLYQRATEKEKEKQRKTAFILFLFPCKCRHIDKLFHRKFSGFYLHAQNKACFDTVDWDKVYMPVFRKKWAKTRNYVVACAGMAIITAIFIVSKHNAKTEYVIPLPETAAAAGDSIFTGTVPHKPEKIIKPENVLPSDSFAQKKPVVIRKTIVKRNTTFIRDTIKLKDTANAF